jgi:hypothetical protein
MSLDAAMEAVERPSAVARTSAEASRSGSGSGGEETDRDLIDDADGETDQGGPGSSRENVFLPGGTEVMVVTDKGKGKQKELDTASPSSTTAKDLEARVNKLSVNEDEDGGKQHQAGLSA